jgi:hypothetical protein
MNSSCLRALLLCGGALSCFAQTARVADPTLDSAGLPGYLKLLPQPAAEPWRKITEKDRFNYYASMTFSPLASLSAAFGAAISQGIDSPHEWGQGWGPYGIRVASSYGSNVVGNTVTYAASAVFRDDNRYFRSNKNGFKARLGAAALSPYVAHNNSGRPRFSTSSFLGGVGNATISLEWSPPSWQGWGNVGVNYLIWYSETAGINLVREFYPSVVRYFKNKSRTHAEKKVIDAK